MSVRMVLFGLGTLGLACASAAVGDTVDLVDPMIGAITAAEDATYGGHGLGKTFPGAVTPFGMVQLSPDTVTGGDNGPGYSYNHRTIEGFSFTHMSGIGWYGDFGNFQVMPGTLDKSAYSHDDERAEAGYYRVRLPDVGVTAELTAEARAGMIRFTYEQGGTGSFKIDLARRIGELTRAKPHGRQTFVRVGDNGFEGMIVCDHRDGGWGRGAGEADYTMYFRGRCSKPLDRLSRTGGATNLIVRADFPVTAGEAVLLHVAISFERMPPMPEGFDFDGMRRAARESWREALSRVEVKGGTDRERRIFATALYHAMIDPRAIGDGDGFVHRTVFSGWDVFRSEMPLLTLIRPDVVRDTILSMAETVETGRRETLPVWDLFGCRSECMLGNPIIPVIAESVNAGVTDYDVRKVYRLAKETSAIRGNIDGHGCSTNWVSLSQTLEYAFDDWCMARLAERYGTPEDVRHFEDRAKWYTNCWDASVGWMRGFDPGGTRTPWRGRLAYHSATAESNPYQQSFFVPHDPEGLIALMGGKRRFTEELESLFECSSPDFLWNDYYNHPNEPCHTLPFLFAYSDKPHLVGKWTRRILARAYGEGVMGLCGNDDVGQMSAWYVLASIGIHPMNPANGQWIVTSPLFAETMLRLDTRYAKAPTFTIRATGTEDPANVCVRSVRLNGKALDRPWITTAEIFAGGTLEIELGPDPEPWKMFDRRLGMFVHWGVYSVGGWHEQERMRKSMSREEYEKYVSGFTAEKFDADAFVDAAESAGAEYIVFTSKHHDGFCMWDTKTTDFNVMNSPARRDVLKELADACKRRGMKLGLYYSNPDWHHPNAYNPKSTHQLAEPNPGDEPDMAKYVEYVKAQITELMSNYGEICCLFWDIPSKVDVPELNELVRRLQPNIKIDDRGWGSKGDYSTPERGVPEGAQFPRPTEACDSVGAQSWGYRRNEDYRTVGYLTRAIDRTLSMGGNFLLNVGPKPDGTIPDEALDRLRRVGVWYGKVRESYRGVETVTNLVRSAMVTRRGNVVYLHYPKGVEATGLDLAPLAQLPCAAKVLNDGTEPPCELEYLPANFWNGRAPSVHLSGIRADNLANESIVVRLELPVMMHDGEELRDACWMWGHDAGHLDGPGNMWKLPVEGKIGMVEACKYMGLENLNVIRWGNPPKAYREQFRGMKRITWPICGHQDERNASFEEMCEYDFRLIDELPNLVGFEMDDFFRDKEPLITVQTDRGPRLSYRSAFSYEKLVALRRRLKSCSRAIDLRLVVYDELLSGDHPEAVVPCAELADVLTYWTWKADDVVDFEKRFAQLRSLVPGKPIFIGIYLWDFGGKLAPMPVRLLKNQLESGLSLWRKGEAAGFVFLATSICKKNLDAVEYVRAWIVEHGEERRK